MPTTAANMRDTTATMSWLVLFIFSIDLFLESSAFLVKKNHMHVRPIASAPGHFRINFPKILGYGGIENIDGDDFSDFGTSAAESPDFLADLPTSNDSMTPEEVVTTCMRYLQGQGDLTPVQERAGLEICYNFSSDSCRMANGGSLESFLQRANNPVFQTMVGCARWEVVNVGPEIAATPTRGSLQTILVAVVPRLEKSGTQRNDRQFLWTIVKERRPPRQGHCLVHECVAVENAFAHTL